jgi:hypothetical protein
MLYITGYCNDCGVPTDHTKRYHVFIYANKANQVFLFIRCADREECDQRKAANGNKSERGIVATDGDSPQGDSQPNSTAILMLPIPGRE